jgi:hypothetical protein
MPTEERRPNLGTPFMKNPRFRSAMVARSCFFAILSVVALALLPDTGWSQPTLHGQRGKPEAAPPPAPAPTPTVDPSSALGGTLAACSKLAEEPGSFTLPGLKGDVALDRCYKGRDNLVCVFNALISEASSLTGSYTKIVDAKYPELNSVEGICKLKRDALASDIAGAEDFTKRFAVLKSQYESDSKCAANVKQAFHDVVLSDMAQPPEILKSMTDSIDADINRLSQAENQIVELAEKMQAATKAMSTIEKIHRTMCFREKTGDGAELGH